MKVAIIGSRTLDIKIDDYLPDGITLVISGGAKGIDQAAERYADKNGIDKLIFLPDIQNLEAQHLLPAIFK